MSMDLEGTRLLQNDPRKAVQDARTDLDALRLVSMLWYQNPETLRHGVLDTFAHHLTSTNPPRNLRNAFQQSGACEFAYLSILALGPLSKFVGSGQPPHPGIDEGKLAALFPALLKWSAFFYTAKVEQTSVPAQVRRSNLEAIGVAWYPLACFPSLAKAMARTEGAIELAAKLWVLEDAFPGTISQTPDTPVPTAVLVKLLEHSEDNAIERLVKGTTLAPRAVAELAMTRLKSWTRSESVENIKVPAGLVYLDVIDYMSRDKGHLLRNYFLNKHKVIPYYTSMALKVAQRLNTPPVRPSDMPALLEILVSAFGYLCNHLNSTDGFTWVLQAVHAGIMKAFVLASPHLRLIDADDRRMVIHPILEVMPLYTAYRTVTTAIGTAMAELDDPRYRRLVEDSLVKEKWVQFRDLVKRRMEAVDSAKEHKGKIATCDNVDCRKTDSKSTFRKCSGCNTSLYCSKECQVTAWRYNHKTVCKLKQEEYLEGKKHAFHKSDEHFFHHLPICDLKRNVLSLRRQARDTARSDPDAASEGFAVHIDYTVVPETISVTPLSKHNWRTPPSERHVVSVDRLPGWSEPRNDELVRRARENPDKLTLIQSVVKYGETSEMVLSVMPRGVFWDLDGAGPPVRDLERGGEGVEEEDDYEYFDDGVEGPEDMGIVIQRLVARARSMNIRGM